LRGFLLALLHDVSAKNSVSVTTMRAFFLLYAGALLLAGCDASANATAWHGTMDTAATGRVTVTNPAEAVWQPGTEWKIVEEVRIGAKDGSGPDVLGTIHLLAEDIGGRIWALEQKEQTFKVFDRDGRFIRKIGRAGKGPGEFRRVVSVTQSRDGHVLAIDMPGGRISMYDTSGTLTRTIKLPEAFMFDPWPGVTDTAGFLIHPVLRPVNNSAEVVLVRYDSAMAPLDTLIPPQLPERDRAVFRTKGSGTTVGIPFGPSLKWELTRSGDFWSVFTGSYTLHHLSAKGDTLRIVTKPFQTVQVTPAEKDSAIAMMKWFVSEGGIVDRTKIPNVKPAVADLDVADDGYVWVRPLLADSVLQQRVVEIFDPEGRFLGRLQLPFPLLTSPRPILRHDRIIGMTQDDNGVTYIVRARIERPSPKH
jgi:hypothetical protein